MLILDLYNHAFILSVYYLILQTSVVSLTTEAVITHESVSVPRLVKSVGFVCLGSYLEILPLVLAFVSTNDTILWGLYIVCEQNIIMLLTVHTE